jgi:hypothetical protein
MSGVPGVPRLGFDIVVDKILNIHRDVGHTHDSAQGVVASVLRQLKSSSIFMALSATAAAAAVVVVISVAVSVSVAVAVSIAVNALCLLPLLGS